MINDEKEKIIDAYNALLKKLETDGFVERDTILGTKRLIEIPKEIFIELEPFFNAIVEKKFHIGDVELVTKRDSGVNFLFGESIVGIEILIPIIEFLVDLQTMIEDITGNPYTKITYKDLHRYNSYKQKEVKDANNK